MKDPWFWIIAEIDPPRIAEIQYAVITVFPGITMNDIKSARRTATVAHARMIAMYLSKMMTLHSLAAIGRYFGNRDHSTVSHSVRKIAALVRTDPIFSAEIEQIKAAI